MRDFDCLPLAGTVVWSGNRRYEFVEARPATRFRVYRLTWKGLCSCKAEYRFETPMKGIRYSAKCALCRTAAKREGAQDARRAWSDRISEANTAYALTAASGDIYCLRLISVDLGERDSRPVLDVVAWFSDKAEHRFSWDSRGACYAELERADYGPVREALDCELERALSASLF